ncbi:MAG: hypothetical protein KJ061_14730 [Vicinamibacteraceae bacterium]|nr:hypothetical protein [Vicinamibacteraceae bacterium]
MSPIDRMPAPGRLPSDEPKPTKAARERLLERLRELVAAINRRVPRAGHAGEARISSDADQLRTLALDQIAQLERPDAAVQD